MRLRWFIKDLGTNIPTRVLQFETAYGWEDVPDVYEAEERQADLAFREEQEYRVAQAAEKRRLEALSYQQRAALKDFKKT